MLIDNIPWAGPVETMEMLQCDRSSAANWRGQIEVWGDIEDLFRDAWHGPPARPDDGDGPRALE